MNSPTSMRCLGMLWTRPEASSRTGAWTASETGAVARGRRKPSLLGSVEAVSQNWGGLTGQSGAGVHVGDLHDPQTAPIRFHADLHAGSGWDRNIARALERREVEKGIRNRAVQRHEAELRGAEGVDKGDDLGRQAAARAADGLGLGSPFAPLAFWWAVTMVPPTRAYSKSGSSDRHAKTRSTTPPFTQRRKRWKTLFQLPKSLGRSRQGTPVRTRHSTASRNSRLSLAVAPGSEGLPGSSGAIFSQTASPTMNRDLSSIAPTPPKRRLKHDPSAGGILSVNRP